MTRAAMLTDLKRSGLTEADAKKAGYKAQSAKQIHALTGNHAHGYIIPYHDIHGKPTDYYRVRYTEEVKGAFGSTKKKPLRYTGPRDAIPQFYFPKRLKWAAIVDNVDAPIVITEGEKKAEAAAKAELPCFSVPGVWAWRSKKKGIAAIPDFDLFKWEGRDVYLCFDNDLMTNPEVIGALNALANELLSRGASVGIKYLPKGPGKIGLDDWLLKKKAPLKAFDGLREEEFEDSKQLWALNEKLAFIDNLSAIYNFDTKKFYKSEQTLVFHFKNLTYKVPKVKGEGFTEKNAATEWLKWKSRRTYDDIAYAPGEAATFDGKVNVWPGWGCEPKKGNVKPFLDLVKFLFKDEPDLLPHFLQWLAYPLQNPGAKNNTAYLFHSLNQGVGKSFVGYIMKDIYGDNFVAVDNEVMKGLFNGWVVNKQFILGEEITGSRARGAADRLKNMITREKLHVNKKYEPEYDIDDRGNYLLTSNHVDALHLEGSDRRLNIVETKGPPMLQVHYDRVGDWRKNGGASSLFHYLLSDVDLCDYNPNAHAPMSAAKQRMVNFSKSDLDMFACDVVDNPDAVLRGNNIVCERDLYEADAIHSFAKSYCDDRPTLTKTAATKALARYGIECREIRFNGKTHRLWPLRNTEAWLKRPNTEWVKHYKKFDSKQKF
jgi:hypothetical protein